MDVGDPVKVINPGEAFYRDVTMNGPDGFMVGKHGTIQSFAMNDEFEPGWNVKMAGSKAGAVFFYEGELEVIDQIDGPVMVTFKERVDEDTTIIREYTKDEIDKMERPDWWEDPDTIRMMLYKVEVEKESLTRHFCPFFTSIGEVYLHLKKLGDES